MHATPPTNILAPHAQSSSRRKAELRASGLKYRSPYPRSPKHGKHAFVQGDPNTKEHNR
jgi:hypothetical protein